MRFTSESKVYGYDVYGGDFFVDMGNTYLDNAEPLSL
jgi:hypothetical protein